MPNKKAAKNSVAFLLGRNLDHNASVDKNYNSDNLFFKS